jgi:hypothetical protein
VRVFPCPRPWGRNEFRDDTHGRIRIRQGEHRHPRLREIMDRNNFGIFRSRTRNQGCVRVSTRSNWEKSSIHESRSTASNQKVRT